MPSILVKMDFHQQGIAHSILGIGPGIYDTHRTCAQCYINEVSREPYAENVVIILV
jgi:hypothetical protein